MFCVGVCMRTALCGVRRPPVRPCAPLGTMCTGYFRRAVPVSSVWLCAHLVRLRGQGVAACGRMYDGRRVKRKFAVWRYRVWGYRAVLWNIVSRMWQIVQSAGRFEKCEYKKSVKSRNLLFRQLCQVRISKINGKWLCRGYYRRQGGGVWAESSEYFRRATSLSH